MNNLSPLFKKLNLKDIESVTVLNAPETFESELSLLPSNVVVNTKITEAPLTFVIAFVITEEKIKELIHAIAPQLTPDTVLWFAYPKKSSKKYKSAISRDNGWKILGKYELEPVRQVAIDQDWSALRFKNIHQIKSFTRNPKMVLSKTGKTRSTKK